MNIKVAKYRQHTSLSSLSALERWLLIIAALALTPFPQFFAHASALSRSDLNSIYDQSEWYRLESLTGTGGQCGTTLVGADNAEKIWNYFIGKGLSPEQTAGILGNFNQESGFLPGKVQGDGESDTMNVDGVTGYGIAQWTYIDRQKALAQFAIDQGRPVSSLDLQLDFAYKEMTEGPVWKNLKQIQNVEEAARYFHSSYERSADDAAGIQERVDDAIKYLGMFGSGTPSGGGQPSECGGDGSPADVISADGYAFPLGPSPQRKSTTTESMPCPQATCHHDGTPAADLMIRGGTAVFAITSGTIGRVNTNYVVPDAQGEPPIPGCSSLNINGNDGWKYWYGHIQNVSVHEGDTVQAGDKIAEVAREEFGPYCFGGGTHLHIDRGFPKGQGGGLVCCRDPSLIPLLNQLWENLPQ